MIQRNKIGRPRKYPPSSITAATTNGVNPQSPTKRRRGRPRKHPLPGSDPGDPPVRLVIRVPTRQPLELPKSPVLPWAWGTVQGGKRVNPRRPGGWAEKREYSGSPSSSVTESNMCSDPGSGQGSECSTGSEQSWFAGIEIPGPIPDLDELMRDPRVFSISDFFDGVPLPDDWDFC